MSDRNQTPTSETQQKGYGKLTVFLGAASGVGKTYAMLEAAQEKLAEGIDVVVGLVDIHGRPEAEVVLCGIPWIAPLTREHEETLGREMNLDEILNRHPQIVLVDDLAHRILPGSRHAKRYQEVEELLSAGIDIYGTLNIQHLESLNDLVRQITGSTITETVPDRILERASSIQVIDITPEELIQRVKDGKVSLAEQETEIMTKFFRPGNINALRELALRYTAKKVDSQLESYMEVHGIKGPWPTGEKVMVCVSGNPFSARLIRMGKRMATRQNTEWLAVHVETPSQQRITEYEKDELTKNLNLAEKLGAEVIGINGDDVAEELLALARKRNVSQIIIGRPVRNRFREVFQRSIVDKVIRQSHGISVHVISEKHEEHQQRHVRNEKDEWSTKETKPLNTLQFSKPLLLSLLMVFLLTLLVHPLKTVLGPINISMLYVLPVLFSAAYWGRLPAIFTAGLGVITFDYFYVPPYYTFSVDDFRYVLSFSILMLTGIVIGKLSSRLKSQIRYSRRREQHISTLYSLSRDLTAVDRLETVLESITHKIAENLNSQVVFLLPDGTEKLVVFEGSTSKYFMSQGELETATWVYESGRKAGRGMETFGEAEALYLPLTTEQGIQGVLGICFNEVEQSPFLEPEHLHLAEAFAGLAAIAINRINLAEEARKIHTLAESERLRTALFNSLSHDLRTPLSSVIGATTSLLEDREGIYPPEVRRDLLQTILQGAERMNRFISNLLDMARMESGMLKLNKDWCDIQDIIGVAVNRLGATLAGRQLEIDVSSCIPLVQADYLLVEQVVINLLDNAFKYSDPDSTVKVQALEKENEVEIAVMNQGNPIPETDLGKIFDKFYRLSSPLQVSGTGLGLAICKGIVEAHGGRIWAKNNEFNGVTLAFSLPLSSKNLITGQESEEGEPCG